MEVESVTPPQEGGDTSAAEKIANEVEDIVKNTESYKKAEQVKKNLVEAGVGTSEEVPTESNTNESFQDAKTKVAEALKARGKSFKEKEAVKQEIETARQEATRIRSEADAYMKQAQASQQRMQQWVTQLRQNPAIALKQAGIDPEEFIMGIAKDGSVENKLQREQRELKERLEQFELWQQKQYEAQQKAAEEAQKQQFGAYRNHVESSFVQLANAGKYTNVQLALESGIVSKRQLISDGHDVADTYREATEGGEAELDDILDYLDSQYGQAISKLGSQKVSAPKNQARPAKAEEAPSRNLGQSLNSELAGERRSLDRTDIIDNAEERKDRAKQAVKAVIGRVPKD